MGCKSWAPWCFQEHSHESGSLTLSGTVEHINSGDDAGTGHRPNKICFLMKWRTVLLMFEGGGGGLRLDGSIN